MVAFNFKRKQQQKSNFAFLATATTLTALIIGMIIQGTLLKLATKDLIPQEASESSESFSKTFIQPTTTTTTIATKRTKQQQQTKNGKKHNNDNRNNNNYDENDPDKDCPFRYSPMYRSIYVYPSPGDDDWKGDILSGHNDNPIWPWMAIQNKTKNSATVHYNPKKSYIQYNSELLVQLLMTHPDSCLRTYDPEKATLFYVPYMPSLEYHNGTLSLGAYQTSPFGQAIMDILGNFDDDDNNSRKKKKKSTTPNYTNWEHTFGLTSKYWQRKQGADHILVFSEPLHGLYHPKSRRGNFHFVHTQKQLSPAIVLSVELSTTFVKQYPNCARKNILLPYPNTDGEWFNYKLDDEYGNYTMSASSTTLSKTKTEPAALPAELELWEQLQQLQQQQSESRALSSSLPLLRPRPLAQYYSAGAHGTCTKLRKTLTRDYKCTPSGKATRKMKYEQGYRQATFCPCPGGDSPSAKRMFDALHAGCIPIVLSYDFVWPFSNEFDYMSPNGALSTLNPSDFSIRLESKMYENSKRDETTCQLMPIIIENATTTTTTTTTTATLQQQEQQQDIQAFIESLTPDQIQTMRQQAYQASLTYSWYERSRDLPNNPLTADVLPTGGAAHMVVQAFAERANGALWPACRDELQQLRDANGGKRPEDARSFKC